MNRYPNLRGVALSVLLAAVFGLLLQTSQARASSLTAAASGDGARCAANPETPGCGVNAASAPRAFPPVRLSRAALLERAPLAWRASSPAVPRDWRLFGPYTRVTSALAPANTGITVTSGGGNGFCLHFFENRDCVIHNRSHAT